MVGPCPVHPLGPRHGVGGVPLGDLPLLAPAEPQVLVAAGVGGPAEADLVPRPGVRVEGGAGVADPELEEALGRHPVPLALTDPDRLDEVHLRLAVELAEPPSGLPAGVLVEAGERSPPGVPILGHLLVPVAVALTQGEPLVDHLEDGYPRLLVLGQ